MADSPRKTVQTKRGHVYSLIHISASTPSRPTLLFLHGFPSTLHDWTHQIEHFSRLGFGIVAPDLLGYGQSSKPSDVSEYRLRPMSDDLVEILDSLGERRVVGVGHDFGATLLSRMVAYYPDRFSALVFVAVGPPAMGTPFDVQMINEMTRKMLGHELLGYVPWLGGEKSDAQEVLERHPESAMSLMFCKDHSLWGEWFRPLGKMKQFVSEDQRAAIGDWYSSDLQQRHLEAFGAEDGYKGAVKWYAMWLENLFAADEVGCEDFQASQPVLFISDATAGGEQQAGMLGAWAANLQVVKLEGGHWLHLEHADATNRAIEDFLAAQSI